MIIAFYIVLGLILTTAQYSFFVFWPVLQYVMPALVLALFATVAHRTAVSFAIVVICGLIFDFYSSAVFGMNILIFAIIWLIIIFTMRRFFTNLSLLSGIAMMALSVLMFRLFTWFFILLLNAFHLMPIRIMISTGWLVDGLWMILINSLIFSIIFVAVNRISKVFNFAFINKR